MKTVKISRSQSREIALQVLYCQHMTDGEMARSMAGVEATKTITELREAMKLLQESRDATETVIRSFDSAIEALSEYLKPAPERKPKKVEAGTLDTVLSLARARRESINAVREATQLMQTHETLFHQDGFALRLLKTYDKHRSEIHTILEQSLDGWAVRRLTAEDSGMLRLGVTEILYFADVPPKVTINEYLELSKVYGDKDSGRLINGVLDRVQLDHPKAEKPA